MTTSITRTSRAARMAAALVLPMALAIPGAAAAEPGGDGAPPPEAGEENFTRTVLTIGLSDPFEVIWGPDDQLWVTERTAGRVTKVDPQTGEKTTILTIPESLGGTEPDPNEGEEPPPEETPENLLLTTPGEQDGLLGMVLHPDLLEGAENQYVFLSYTYNGGDVGPAGELLDRRQRLVRYTYDADAEALGDPEVLIEGLPASDDHNSGRFVMLPDGRLLYTIGDRGNLQDLNACKKNEAQRLPTAQEVARGDWTAYQGKTLRLNQDGSIPKDNPRLNGVRSHVYTYGHRNPQGLTVGPEGRPYSSEQGPKSDDELNLLEAGGNYGWPNVSGYTDDSAYVFADWSAWPECTPQRYSAFDIPAAVPQMAEHEFTDPALVPPLRTFYTVPTGHNFRGEACAPSGFFFICYPTVAPASLEFYARDGIPGWGSSFLMPTLKHGTLYRLPLLNGNGREVDGPLPYFTSVNRYRDTAVSPDGTIIYVATDSTGLARGTNGDATDQLENPGSILSFRYDRSPR